MYYAMAHQKITHDDYDNPAVRQTISIPARSLTVTRTVSERHPRKPWVKSGNAEIWAVRPDEEYAHAPVLMQVSDAEVADIISGTIPRNVVLRFQRAVSAINGQVVGKGAVRGSRPGLDCEVRGFEDALAEMKVGASLDSWDDREAVCKQYVEFVDTLIRTDSRETLYSMLRDGTKAHDRNSHHPHGEFTGEGVPAAADAPTPEPAVPSGLKVSRGAVKPGDRLERPNGEWYVALKVDMGIKGLSDVQMYRDAAAAGEHILTLGEPGAGKTAALEVAFPGLVTMVGTRETEPSDFIGSYVATVDAEGREVLTWEDGPLLIAMETGSKLYIDEVGVIPPNHLTMLYQVMDGRDSITVTANPARGTVKAKPGFSVVASINPNAPGVRMSEALLSRFDCKVWVSTDYEVMRSLGVDDRMVDMALHLAKLVDADECSWAPQSREMLRFQRQKDTRGIVFALQSFLTNVPGEEMEVVAGIVRERWGDIPGAAKLIRPMKIGG